MVTGFSRKQGVQQLTKEKPRSFGISSSRLGSNLLGHVGKSSDLVSRTDQGDVCAQETSNVSELCWTFPANYIQLNPTHVYRVPTRATLRFQRRVRWAGEAGACFGTLTRAKRVARASRTVSKEPSLLPPERVESLASEEALSWALCRCRVRGVHSEQEKQEHEPGGSCHVWEPAGFGGGGVRERGAKTMGRVARAWCEELEATGGF